MQGLSAIHIAIAYLAIINVVTFFVYGIDKWKAKRSKWRISEATLLILAVIGGSIGAWIGMKMWHHKTLHKKFRYGIPIIILLQIALLVFTSCGAKQTVVKAEPTAEVNVPEHSPSVFLVMYDSEIGKDSLLKAINDYKVEVIYDYNIINGMALKKPNDKSLKETISFFKKIKGVVSVEYDHVYRLTDPVKPKLEIQ